MKYLHALNIISGVGPQKIKMLLNHFETAENVWAADFSMLGSAGIGPKLSERIISEKKNISPEAEWEKLEKNGISVLDFNNENFPAAIRETSNPPYIIYAKGKFLDINISPLIAVVGSRKYTPYGAQIALQFSKDLSEAGITVVSGMAIGIDTFAHRGALDAGGKTIAILGNGLDDESIYPANNFHLSREIIENGALLSEYPLETKAGKLTFPARNRIVAGMTIGTVVIEAGEDSGALITAQMALDFNREVFSIPGSIFSPQSVGTNNLIKKGAKLVSGVRDILEELDLNYYHQRKESIEKIPESQEEKTILHVLSPDPLHIDNISKLTRLKTNEVSSTLSIMEIKGWVKNIGGQNYILL